ECGEGFESDGEAGCKVVLPASPCDDGEMALPGDTKCSPIADCGEGDYGNILSDGDTQHVNAQSGDDPPDGSAMAPWKTIQQAIDAATPGATIAIATGSYGEPLIIKNKNVHLWGRCPRDVTIGSKLTIQGATGTIVEGVSFSGERIVVFATEDLTIRKCHFLHGMLKADLAPERGTIRVERVLAMSPDKSGGNLDVVGHDLEVTDSVFRGYPGNLGHRGIEVREDSMGRSGKLDLQRSVFESHDSISVKVVGSDAIIERCYFDFGVADSNASGNDGINSLPDGSRKSTLTLQQSVFEGGHRNAVEALNTETLFDRLTVRNSTAQAVTVDLDTVLAAPNYVPTCLLRKSLFDDTAWTGFQSAGVSTQVEACIFRNNRSKPNATKSAADNISVSQFGYGYDHDKNFNTSSYVQSNSIEIYDSVVSGGVDQGILVLDSEGLVSHTLVERIAGKEDGSNGNGIGVISLAALFGAAVEPRTTRIIDCEIRDNNASGIANFSSTIAVSDSRLWCNGWPFNLWQTLPGSETGSYENGGGNKYGYNDIEECQVSSNALMPPIPLP
ncbi:DUF1565 domain-containing protein, partial [Endomicrobium sp. AH-315-J14]|nr:DUF1565 domain-containing protein [Endomicrobium sp. AH-315-J14]